MGARVKRAVIIAAVVLLAGVSAPRLQLDYMPRLALPELTASVSIAGGADDPEETTTRWIVPVEAAVRSLGDVTATRVDVRGDTADLTIRFARGTDVEVKAARLASELAPLRAQLPRGSELGIWPSAQTATRPAAIVALTGPDAAAHARRTADALRAARGVRDVRVFGAKEREVTIQLARDFTGDIHGTLAAALAPRALGEMRVGTRDVPLIVGPTARHIEDVRVVAQGPMGPMGQTGPIGQMGSSSVPSVLSVQSNNQPLRLGAIAHITNAASEPRTMARVNGKPAVLLALYREDDVSLFTFDASLREKLAGLAHEEVWSDATELRAILTRVGIGAIGASLLLAAIGFVLAGARGVVLAVYVPLTVAVAMNVFRLADVRIDASTVVLACIAAAGLAPLAVSRLVSKEHDRWPLVVAAVFLTILPLAATFGSGALAPFLAPAARAFLMTGLSALAACAAIPRLHTHAATTGGWQRRSMRGAASLVLAGTTVTALLLAYFGQRLDPRSEAEGESTRVSIRVTLPAGTTLAQTTDLVERIERPLRKHEDVTRFWSFTSPGFAGITMELRPALRDPAKMDLFRIRLMADAPFAPGIVSFGGGSGGARFVDDLEERAETDELAFRYRFLLKGTDAETLRRTADELSTKFTRIGIIRGRVAAEWPAPAARLELVPRSNVPPAEAESIALELARRSFPPIPRRLPDGRAASVIAYGAPKDFDDVPQRTELFARVPSLAARFDTRTEFVAGGLLRELGRYVLPVTIRIPGHGEQKLGKRDEIDRVLSLAQLPAGVALERPSLTDWSFSVAKLRLLALAAFLPLLLIGAAAIALDSFASALAAVSASVAGVACAAPALLLTSSNVDELTLLAIAAAVCCTCANAVVVLIRSRAQTNASYRTLRRFAVPSLAAAGAMLLVLLAAASAPAASRDGWRAPLIAVLSVFIAGMPASLIVAPAIGVMTRDVRRRRTTAARAASRPAEWVVPVSKLHGLTVAQGERPSSETVRLCDSETAPHLAIRNVTKDYASGFRALRRVSFELEPGIVGLLGPNGAGKTTLLRIITGLLLPTRGQVLYRGVPVGPNNLAEYRRLIGFLPQEFNAYAGLTANDFLDFWALERGMNDARARRAEVERLLEIVGLTKDAHRRVRDFSGGMRQRIGIARALLDDPALLVVDEPTTGLDLESRNHFREVLASLAADRIIIFSTHIASDIEATASRILLLTKGTLRWDGTPDALTARAHGRVFDAVVSEADARQFTTTYRVTTRQRVAGGIRIRGVVPQGVELPGPAAEPTLEEAYLAEAATDRAIRATGFAFLFARQ